MTDAQLIGSNIISHNEPKLEESKRNEDLCLKEKSINSSFLKHSLENDDLNGVELKTVDTYKVDEKENKRRSKSDGVKKKKIASMMSSGLKIISPNEKSRDSTDNNYDGTSKNEQIKVDGSDNSVNNNEDINPSKLSKNKTKAKSKPFNSDSTSKSKFKESVNQSTLNTFLQIKPSVPQMKSKNEEDEENDIDLKVVDEPEKDGKVGFRISMNLFKSPRRSITTKSRNSSKLSTSKKKSLITSENDPTETKTSLTNENIAETKDLSSKETKTDDIEKETETEIKENITKTKASLTNDQITESEDIPSSTKKTCINKQEIETEMEVNKTIETKASSVNKKLTEISDNDKNIEINNIDINKKETETDMEVTNTIETKTSSANTKLTESLNMNEISDNDKDIEINNINVNKKETETDMEVTKAASTNTKLTESLNMNEISDNNKDIEFNNINVNKKETETDMEVTNTIETKTSSANTKLTESLNMNEISDNDKNIEMNNIDVNKKETKTDNEVSTIETKASSANTKLTESLNTNETSDNDTDIEINSKESKSKLDNLQINDKTKEVNTKERRNKEKITKNNFKDGIKSKNLKDPEKKSGETKSKQKREKYKKTKKVKETKTKTNKKLKKSVITDDDLDDFEIETNIGRSKSKSRNNTPSTTALVTEISEDSDENKKVLDIDKIEETIKIDDEIDESDKPKTTINAFQYMMDRRNKVIGSNSPGKELDTSGEINISQSDKNYEAKRLQSRKKLLEDWNQIKGGVKRKIIDAEREEYIEYALEKRAKRMKKLLKVDSREEKCTPKEKQKKDNNNRNSIKPEIDSQKKLRNKEDLKSKEDIETKRTEEINIIDNENESLKPNGILENKEETLKVNHVNKLKEEEEEEIAKTPKNKKRKKVMKLDSSSSENSNDAKETNLPETNKILVIDNKIYITSDESNDVLQENNKSLSSKSNKSLNDLNGSKTQTGILNFFGIVSKHTDDDKANGTKETNSNNQSLTKTKGKTKKSVVKRAIAKSSTKTNVLTSESDTDSEVTVEYRRRGRPAKNRKTKECIITLEDSKSAIEEETTKSTDVCILVDDSKSDVDDVIAEGPRRSTRTRKLLNYEEDGAETKKDKQTKLKTESTKIAPVFIKAMPKLKIDPAILEARRSFLYSGVPDGLKRVIDKQLSVENMEYDVFPSISHIQQKDEDSTFWNLPEVDLNLKYTDSFNENLIPPLNSISILNNYEVNNQSSELSPPTRKILLKPTVNEIKEQHPELPIYKIFKTLYDKSGFKKLEPVKAVVSSIKKKRGRPKRRKSSDDDVKIIENPPEPDSFDNLTWTDKYKPKSIDEIISNKRCLIDLKNWLKNWIDFSKETKAAKRRRLESSDFESMDDSSCDSMSSRVPQKTMILNGPPGSGKTTAVYAVCKDLNIKILELNSSSKRTGKKLLQELQEATQSHQVHKKDNSLLSMVQKKGISLKTGEKKMCLLFIEDVDIVFEQDEGFISSLTQLLLTSKRPVVMTTSGVVNWHMSKFEMQYTTLSFKPFSGSLLSAWLQMVCLLEGVNISRNSLGEILDFNKGDIRKTLLYLQYWVQTGCTKKASFKSSYEIGSIIKEKHKLTDDLLDLTYLGEEDSNLNSPEIYDGCIVPFLTRNSLKSFLPLNTKLSTIWWNLPYIFSIDCHKSKIEQKNTTLKELKDVSDFMDAISFTDVVNRTAGLDYDLEPCYKTWEVELKEGLSLSENMMNQKTDWDFHNEFNHTLLDGYCRLQKDINVDVRINMAVPRSSDKRWRKQQEACSSTFMDAVPWSTSFPRSSFACDYFPALRIITRSETVRNGNTNKRNNRFYNYIRTLNINPSSAHIETACKMLVIKDS